MTTEQKIRKVATKVRKWADANTIRFGHTKRLMGMCAITSGMIFTELNAQGIKAKLIYSWGHVFIISNGYVVDVTASQFCGGPKVRILKIQDATKDHWERNRTFLKLSTLKTWQVQGNWPRNQLVDYRA